MNTSWAPRRHGGVAVGGLPAVAGADGRRGGRLRRRPGGRRGADSPILAALAESCGTSPWRGPGPPSPWAPPSPPRLGGAGFLLSRGLLVHTVDAARTPAVPADSAGSGSRCS